MVKIWSMAMVIPQSWGIPYHGELTPLTPIVYGQMSIPFLWENKPCFDHGTRVENGLHMATGARQLKLGTAVSCLAPKPALSCRGHPDGTNMTDFVSEKVTLIMASLHKSESLRRKHDCPAKANEFWKILRKGKWVQRRTPTCGTKHPLQAHNTYTRTLEKGKDLIWHLRKGGRKVGGSSVL